MSNEDNTWKNLDFSEMRDRLREVQHLLRQAAAVGATADLEKLKTFQKASDKRTEAPRERRRYR